MTPSSTHSILLGDILTIRDADALRTRLSEELREGVHLDLDCAENPDVDLWFAQLIISFGKAAHGQASTIALSSRLTDSLRSILERGGFPIPFPQESLHA